MILRNKIIIGAISVASISGATIALVFTLKKDDKSNFNISKRSPFITSVNAANEYLKVKPDNSKDQYQRAFGNSVLSYNAKNETFVIDFKPWFDIYKYQPLPSDSKEEQTRKEKMRLLQFGTSLGITGNYYRYVKSNASAILKTNSIFLPTSLFAKQIPSFDLSTPSIIDNKDKQFQKELQNLLQIQGAIVDKNFQARDTISEQDGIIRIMLPFLNKSKEPLYRYTLKLDTENPVLIDPIKGGSKELKDITIDEIKRAIVKQFVKFANFVDMVQQTLEIKNVSSINKISDTTIASFSRRQKEVTGKYTAVVGKATELIKLILGLKSFKSEKTEIEVVKTLSDYYALSQEDKNINFYKYNIQSGKLEGFDLLNIDKGEYAYTDATNKWYGLLIKPQLKEVANPFYNPQIRIFISDFLATINKDAITNYIKKHQEDTDFYSKDKGKKYDFFSQKNKLFNWYDSTKKQDKLNEYEAIKELINSGYQKFENFGYIGSFVNSGQTTNVAVGRSIGEILKRFFLVNKNQPTEDDFLKLLSQTSLFEHNEKAVDKIAPHSITSIRYPVISGLGYDGIFNFNFARNYRIDLSSSKQKVFSLAEIKTSIFGNSSVSDEDLLTFFYLMANIFANGLDYIEEGKPIHVTTSGKFIIGTSINDEDMKTKLSTIPALKNQQAFYTVDNGFIIFDKNRTSEKKDNQDFYNQIIAILDFLFDKEINPEIKIQDIGKIELQESILDGKKYWKTKPAQYTQKKVSNPMSFSKDLINSAKKKVADLLKKHSFQKSFGSNSTSAVNSQSFALPSRSLQNKLNILFQKIFLDPQNFDPDNFKFKNNKNGKFVKDSLVDTSKPDGAKKIDMLEDFYINGFDIRGPFNVAYPKTRITRAKQGGNRVVISTIPSIVMKMQKKVSGNQSIYKFDVISRFINNPPSFIKGNANEKFVQIVAFITMLDKLKIRFKIQVPDKSNISKAIAENLFGSVNIHSFSQATSSSLARNSFIEFKLGHYLDAMNNYIVKVYAPQIAADIKSRLDDISKKMDNVIKGID